jgi:hypothetical protein
VAATDPPSPALLATLHYLQDRANYGRSYPRTTSDAAKLIWFFIKRELGWPVKWPLPQIAGMPGVEPPLEDVAGVTSIRADGNPALTGAVTLASGSNITLGQAGQTITVNATPGLSSLILFDSTLGAPAASIDTGVDGIAQTAETLLVMMLVRTTDASTISTVNVTVNGDAGANYDRQIMRDNNVTQGNQISLGQTQWALSACGANMGAGAAALLTITLHAYRQTTFHKVGLLEDAVPDTAAANTRRDAGSLRWRNTAAISRLAVAAASGNLDTGSRLTVYGLL